MRPLADVLSAMLLTLWPRRRHQELLLDLGERKGWTNLDRAAAVVRLAEWLIAEVHLPGTLHVAPRPRDGGRRVLPKVPLDSVKPVGGVGAHTVALARLAGVAPKTLANTLQHGLRPDRRDHRWILFLARLELEEVRAEALVFHRRSPAAVAAVLAAGADAEQLDAGDALLLLSLVALWQRRRRPGEARASRGGDLSRRALPKPVAALESWVVSPSQVVPLVAHGAGRGGAAGRALIAVTLDAALADAHLAPHQPRRTGSSTGSGEAWLTAVDKALGLPAARDLIGETETAVFRWRVARMRGYAAGTPTPPPEPLATGQAYVALASAIDDAIRDRANPSRFSAREPGYFMLLPQARRLGLLEDG